MSSPTNEDKALAELLVARGYLAPAQANQVLKVLRDAAAAGKPQTLQEVILNHRVLSPRRWKEFEKTLNTTPRGADMEALSPEEAAAALKMAAPTGAPGVSAQPSDEDALALPFELGGYRLIQKIGQGGMGSVYKAVQTNLRRYVAVKILPKRLAGDPKFVERFRREARAAAALNHPNMVVPIDVGETGGRHFLAMEFIEGENLGQWMEREGRLNWHDALEVAVQICKGLEHAHQLGIVHRDIKPDNILVEKSTGLAKITDLGLVKRKNEESLASQAGGAVGTPYYISPEQARGVEAIDGRADVYSLGATLWHLLAGVPPFEGPNPAVVMTKHLIENVPDPCSVVDGLPEEVAAIIFKAMAKSREERYASCKPMREDLDAVLHNKPLKHAPLKKRNSENTLGELGPGLAPEGPQRSRNGQPGASRHTTGSRAKHHGISRGAGGSSAGGKRLGLRRSKAGLNFGLIAGIAGLVMLILAIFIYYRNNSGTQPLKAPPNPPKTGSK